MDRIELTAHLMSACIDASVAVTGFLERPRKYSDDENLYMREVHFVVALGSKEQPTMSEMADHLNVTPGAVTQIVSRLEKKGYVSRIKSAKDKRQTTVILTDKGRALCEDHITYDKSKFQNISELLETYSDQDIRYLIDFEKKVHEMFTNFQ